MEIAIKSPHAGEVAWIRPRGTRDAPALGTWLQDRAGGDTDGGRSPGHGGEGHLRGASPPVLWTINQLKDILIYAHQIGLSGIRLISKCFSAHYFPGKIFS